MNDKNDIEKPIKKEKNWGPGGGLYRGAKISVKTLNWIIAILMVALVATVIYLASTSHYSITFNTNGGDNISAYQCKYGEYVQAEIPSKTGYTFAGWFENEELTKQWQLEKDTVKQSMTLYASWQPSLIRVLFDLDGGMVDQQASISHLEIPFYDVYGSLPIPEKVGFTFMGWQYNGMIIQKDTQVTMNGEHTLKAIWK